MGDRYDAIVIGTGQAGPALAVRLAKAGRKTAIIERKLFGGTCVNNGCIPTKTLIASARAAQVARSGSGWGVVVPPGVHVDMPAVKARKDAVVRQSRDGVADWLKGTPGVTVIEGHARFEGQHAVRVGDRLLEAPQIFVNVGGRASVPAITGIADVPYLDNVTMMDVDTLPRHLVIVGGSYIGLEFAQMYHRFGSRGDGRRNDVAADRPGGPGGVGRDQGDSGSRGNQDPAQGGVPCGSPSRRWRRRRRRVRGGAARDRRLASAARDGSPAEHRRPWLRARRHRARRARLHRRRRPVAARTSRGSGRSATSTAVARSRTRRTTITKSSPRTSSMAKRAASRTGFRRTRCSSIRRSAAPG